MSAQAAMARRKAYAVKRNHGYSYTQRRSMAGSSSLVSKMVTKKGGK